MRHLVPFLMSAVLTAGALLWWLEDGDLRGTVVPVVAGWSQRALEAAAESAAEAMESTGGTNGVQDPSERP